MNQKTFLKGRSHFQHKLAEMTVSQIREMIKGWQFLSLCNSRERELLMNDIQLMVDYKSTDHSTNKAWDSIERGWAKS